MASMRALRLSIITRANATSNSGTSREQASQSSARFGTAGAASNSVASHTQLPGLSSGDYWADNDQMDLHVMSSAGEGLNDDGNDDDGPNEGNFNDEGYWNDEDEISSDIGARSVDSEDIAIDSDEDNDEEGVPCQPAVFTGH